MYIGFLYASSYTADVDTGRTSIPKHSAYNTMHCCSKYLNRSLVDTFNVRTQVYVELKGKFEYVQLAGSIYRGFGLLMISAEKCTMH